MFEQQEEPEPAPTSFDADADAAMGEPSAETLRMLLAADPATLDRDDAVAAAAGAELAKRLLDAYQLRCLAAAAGTRRQPGDVSEVGQELSAATNMQHTSASCRTDLGCSAVTRLPRTLGHLEAGRYTLRHVEQVERATRDLTDEQARRVDRQLPRRPVRLKRKLAEAISRIDPDHLERKTERATSGRAVDFWTDALEGTAGLGVQGPIAPVATIKAAVDYLAGPNRPGECRTLNQRRFDAVHDWARTVLGLTTAGLPAAPTAGRRSEGAGATSGAASASPSASDTTATAHGDCGTGAGGDATASATTSGATSGTAAGAGIPGGCGACGRSGPAVVPINVTVSLEALLQLSEEPGDLNGDPIPASVARELAGDGRWRRFVTEPATGRLLDVGANTYRPNAALARFVRGRDRMCTFPSCTRPAERCELDHLQEFDRGGQTIETNLEPKCGIHHRLRHLPDWHTSRTPDGHTDWTAPSGRVYRNPADHYGDDPALSAYLTRSTAIRRARQAAERQQAEQRKRAEEQKRIARKRRPTRGSPDLSSRPPNRGRATPNGEGSAPDPWIRPPDARANDPWMPPPNPDEETPF